MMFEPLFEMELQVIGWSEESEASSATTTINWHLAV
jgi:hypothetical protein